VDAALTRGWITRVDIGCNTKVSDLQCTLLFSFFLNHSTNRTIIEREIRTYISTFLFLYLSSSNIKEISLAPSKIHVMESLGMDSDLNYSVFFRKHNRNLGNNWTISIGIHSEKFHNTCSVLHVDSIPKFGSSNYWRKWSYQY